MTRKSSAQGALAARRAGFRRALLDWYRRSHRRLPWRESPSAYGTVVSELMLQQTQVSTVVPYFTRWMSALPDFAALARAPEAAVMKLWEGLGYYRRARSLHLIAKAVVKEGMPTSAAGWEQLPGVGPYTSASIASIAFGEPVACVDGNVVRILARLTRDGTLHAGGAAAAKAFTGLAQELLNPAEAGDHNQAMMELGATVCVKHGPMCLICPVRAYCSGAEAGDAASYPRLKAKPTEQRSVVRVWCVVKGSLLLHRNPPDARRLANIHELPTPEQAGLSADQVAGRPLLAKGNRGITRFRITESIHSVVKAGKVSGELVWIPVKDLALVTLSGPHRRWSDRILSCGAAVARD